MMYSQSLRRYDKKYSCRDLFYDVLLWPADFTLSLAYLNSGTSRHTSAHLPIHTHSSSCTNVIRGWPKAAWAVVCRLEVHYCNEGLGAFGCDATLQPICQRFPHTGPFIPVHFFSILTASTQPRGPFWVSWVMCVRGFGVTPLRWFTALLFECVSDAFPLN